MEEKHVLKFFEVLSELLSEQHEADITIKPVKKEDKKTA